MPGLRLLVAVGSASHKACSVGAFARAETLAFRRATKTLFEHIDFLEPTADDAYPICSSVTKPDVIFFHAPALHDRKKPWNALKSAMILRKNFPRAIFLSIVHELTEAPWHWRLRQILLLKISHGAIANTASDTALTQPHTRRVLRSRLGPTLDEPELIASLDVSALDRERTQRRERLQKPFLLDPKKKWLLHPGLITPGKGVDTLERVLPVLDNQTQLIVMGGFGPKERDREFAQKVLTPLREKLDKRFVLVTSPSDQTYKEFLMASDLVILPYDVGISERRSSFLSAASCGANVWTTTGQFSKPMELEKSGAHSVGVDTWKNDFTTSRVSIHSALHEPFAKQLERRCQNLKWARGFAWQTRITNVENFILKEFGKNLKIPAQHSPNPALQERV